MELLSVQARFGPDAVVKVAYDSGFQTNPDLAVFRDIGQYYAFPDEMIPSPVVAIGDWSGIGVHGEWELVSTG